MSRLNWIHDPMPPATRRQDDLTSPATASAKNTPPSEVRLKLPRRLRPRRRGKKQPASSANENSPRLASSAATRLMPTANRNSPIPGNQPGISQPMRSTPVEHPRTFLHPQHSQFPRLRTNENAERQSRLDHPEIQGVYKPARIDPRQDSTANCQRDNFSGFGLSSPALQQPPTKPFSGPPSRQHLTDPTREAREAGRQGPGIVYPLLCAARPDTRLSIDAAPPEAAVLRRGERPPTVVDIPEPGRIGGTRLPGPSQPRGLHSPSRQSRKRPRNRSSGVYRPRKRSPHRGHWCE